MGLVNVHQAGLPSLPNSCTTPKACSRWRASAGRLASHLSAPHALKQLLACGLPSVKADTTSAPTSKACGPMHGPSHAINSVSPLAYSIIPGGWIAPKTVSRIPFPFWPARLRQPACTAATTLPRRSHSSMGRQSATSALHAKPVWRVKAASAGILSGVSGTSSSTCVPCTWFRNTAFVLSVRCRRTRLCCTADGSSPTWSPRFRLL